MDNELILVPLTELMVIASEAEKLKAEGILGTYLSKEITDSFLNTSKQRAKNQFKPLKFMDEKFRIATVNGLFERLSPDSSNTKKHFVVK